MKDFLEKNCFTKTGRIGLNPKVSNKLWWESRGFLKELNTLLKISNNIPEAIWCSLNERPKCKVCGKLTKFKNYSFGYYEYCSRACSTSCPERNKKIASNTNFIESRKKGLQSQIQKYGKPYLATEEGISLAKKTKLEKYGDLNFNNKEKASKTCMLKYGANSFFGSESGIALLKEKRNHHGGSFKVSQESLDLLNDKEFLIKCNESMSYPDIAEIIGVTPKSVKLRFDEFNIEYKRHPSRFEKLQKEVFETFKQSNSIYNCRKTLLSGKELDIYFPDKKIAIEVNGVYWHSYDSLETSEQRYRHLDKRKECESQGIRLIQFTDIEWNSKKEIVKGIVNTALGNNIPIYARKCEVRKVSKTEEKEFFNSNHIQGFGASKISFGLYYNGELIQAISFSKPRFNKTYDWEIVRLATKIGYSVIGGIQKLKKYFPEGSIISYCDLDKFSGNVYKTLGLDLISEVRPSYFWYSYKTGILSRYQTQKKNLSFLLENFDPEKSEAGNMFASGFRRYWNSGQAVYAHPK